MLETHVTSGRGHTREIFAGEIVFVWRLSNGFLRGFPNGIIC
jgi:hypothetical protein